MDSWRRNHARDPSLVAKGYWVRVVKWSPACLQAIDAVHRSLEHHRTASFLGGTADVDDYQRLASDLLTLAYTEDEGRSLIEAEIEKRENSRA
jgi:hypothetical protein